MRKTLMPAAVGDDVRELQRLLNERLALDPPLVVDGHFGPLTLEALYAFQASSVGPDGRPLTVDGIVGPVTWWALTTHDQSRAFATEEAPLLRIGHPRCDLAAAVIDVAVEEMRARAREIGGNNQGTFVRKYLRGGEAPWCAGFASFCVSKAADRVGVQMPFGYSGSARGIRNQLAKLGFSFNVGDEEPYAGDLVFWWRVAPNSWQGHVGIVTDYANGVMWTIEGNRGSFPAPVRQFSYVVEREKRMLGFAKLCA